jgi:hypothetical protein
VVELVVNDRTDERTNERPSTGIKNSVRKSYWASTYFVGYEKTSMEKGVVPTLVTSKRLSEGLRMKLKDGKGKEKEGKR